MEKFLDHLKKKTIEHVNIANKLQDENNYLTK